MTLPNKTTAHNAGWRSRFRFAVNVLWSSMCKFVVRPHTDPHKLPMRVYDDHRISFPVPDSWQVSHDPSGNILYMDPSDSGTWCFVQLGGLRPKPGGKLVPSARACLARCYESELKSGTASIVDFGGGRAVVEWPEVTTHDGREFIVYHFHLASSTESGEVQLATFSLAVPKAMKDLPRMSSLQEMVREQARVAEFHPWHDCAA